MCLDPFDNLGQMLVLLADVVLLAEVNEEDNWLCREEEEWVNVFDLCTNILSV
jgi:hypothetical protein